MQTKKNKCVNKSSERGLTISSFGIMDVIFTMAQTKVCATVEGMYQVMQLHAGPDSRLLQSDEELQDFTNHQEASIIGEPRPPWSHDFWAPGHSVSLFHTLPRSLFFSISHRCVLWFRWLSAPRIPCGSCSAEGPVPLWPQQ